MNNIFKIRKSERWLALAALLIFAALNALLFVKYGKGFLHGAKGGFWLIFHNHFQVSGYDVWSLIFMSNEKIYFEITRHPFFAIILFPFYWLNQWLMPATGVNFAMIFMALLLLVAAFYSFIFLHRVFREVLEMKAFDSLLLTLFFYGCGSVMTAVMVPDHFCWSIFLLTMTLYLSGMAFKRRRQLPTWVLSLLALFTGGVTLNNIAKTWLSGWFVNGRKFWRVKSLLAVVVLPCVLFAASCLWQIKTIQEPQSVVDKRIGEKTIAKHPEMKKNIAKHNQWMKTVRHKPITDKPFLNWIDTTTPKGESIVENLFGESIQLHTTHTLGDMCVDRPMIVKYDYWFNYFVEAVVVLLFFLGIFFGVSSGSKFYWMCLSWFGLDMFLHLVLGFGLNEVYIMGPHWLFFIPISVAYMFRRLSVKPQCALRVLLTLLTLYLWTYNGALLTNYMLN